MAWDAARREHEREWRSCPWCFYGGCLPPWDPDGDYDGPTGDGKPCSDPSCRCPCRICPYPKPEPGQPGYGCVIAGMA